MVEFTYEQLKKIKDVIEAHVENEKKKYQKVCGEDFEEKQKHFSMEFTRLKISINFLIDDIWKLPLIRSTNKKNKD